MEATHKSPCNDLMRLEIYLESCGVVLGIANLQGMSLPDLHRELLAVREAVRFKHGRSDGKTARARLLAALGYLDCHIAATEGAMRLQALGVSPDLFMRASHATMSQAVFQHTVRAEGERA